MPNDIRIFRVVIEVSNLSDASAFYTELLNKSGRYVGGNRYYIDCGTIILALLETERQQAIPQFIYFSVPNLEEIHHRAHKLNCISHELVHDKPAGEIIHRPWGERSFYAVDPYGNGLCFVHETTLFTGK